MNIKAKLVSILLTFFVVFNLLPTSALADASGYHYDGTTGTLTVYSNGETQNSAAWRQKSEIVNNVVTVVLDDSITSVGDGFDGLPELTTVWIGENVTGFVRPFTQCPKLVEINVSEKNAYFESVDGVLFAEDGAGNLVRLVRYPQGKPDERYEVPEDVEIIGDRAFHRCENLNVVTLPPSLKTIGDYVFMYCRMLSSINIPDSVTSIGYEAFANSGLESVAIPDQVAAIKTNTFMAYAKLGSVEIGAGVNSIDYNAFTGCVKLEEIIVSAENESFESIDGVLYAEDGAGNLVRLVRYPQGKTGTSYVVPDGVETIGQRAFYDNNGYLTSIEFPDSVTAIETEAVYGCSQLVDVRLGDGLETIGVRAFSGAKFPRIVIPATVTSIANSAFSGNSSLKVVVAKGDTAPNLGTYVFSSSNSFVFVPVGAFGYTTENGWPASVFEGMAYLAPTPTVTFTATEPDSGTLSNVDTTMKYSVDGGSTWISVTGATMDISGVTATNGIKVKRSGNRTTTLDSEVQTITVTRRKRLQQVRQTAIPWPTMTES